MTSTTTKKPLLSVFSLVMINVIAIDSLRNVPAAAEYGLSLIFYYVIAVLAFFIPSSMVSAELATGWPKDGGIYVWVKEAFGYRWGLFAIWLQWIENVIWYPTIMSFIASTLLFAINPTIAENKLLLLVVMIALFWFGTFLNMRGMRSSAYLSEFSAILGTIIPMLLIIGLGIHWLWKGYPNQIIFAWKQLIPDFTHVENLTFMTGILLSLVGMELSAAYAQSVEKPQRDYPRAMMISVCIIITTLTLSSLAIAVVVPKSEINLVNGLVRAFSEIFDALHISWVTGLVAAIIIIGGFGNVAAWILGPSKGLWAASQDGSIPKLFSQLNQQGAPSALLILQATIFTVLCTLFLYMPTISSSYWILTALTTQLYMLMYLLMFSAAIWLRYKRPDVQRSYRIPGPKNMGMWLVGGVGALASFSTILIGFLPPQGIPYGNLFTYEVILSAGFILLSLPPILYSQCRHRHLVVLSH